MHDTDPIPLKILLQTAKTNAKLCDIKEDVIELLRVQAVIEKDRLHAYNTYYKQMDALHRQQDQGHALATAIHKELSVIRQQGRRLTTVGLALIFGGSVVSQTQLLGMLSKLF